MGISAWFGVHLPVHQSSCPHSRLDGAYPDRIDRVRPNGRLGTGTRISASYSLRLSL